MSPKGYRASVVSETAAFSPESSKAGAEWCLRCRPAHMHWKNDDKMAIAFRDPIKSGDTKAS